MNISDLSLLPAGNWAEVNRAFTWRVQPDFSMARACCDDWARMSPDRTAIIDLAEDGTRVVWTFGRLKDASDRLAAAMRHAGVRKGDRVAILLSQCPEVMVAHFAAMKLGAVVLPLFTLFGEDALSYRLIDSGAVVAVTDAAHLDKLVGAAAGSALHTIVTKGGVSAAGAPRIVSWEDALAGAQVDFRAAQVGAEDPAVLIYTSGTTGAPKGALHAHRFLLGHLPSVEMVLERPRAGDIAWTPADWAWIGGLMDLAMPTLYFGLPLVSQRMRKFDPEAAFRLIRDERISIMFLPPTALKMMRQVEVPRGLSTRAIGSGGESLGADFLAWGVNELRAPINELYGQTECNLVVSSSAGLGVTKPGTMGRAVPGHEVAIIDESGTPLPAGEVGEIAVRRGDPVMFLGYWNLPDKTKEKFVGDWLRTGDLGRADEEGYLTYVGRDDDVITSAGYRIGPTEIENCLIGDPDVVNAAVVGVPDPARTEIVKAFVVVREGAPVEGLSERLIQRVRDRVSPHVAPRAVEFLEALPVTATGKIMRRVLRERG
ncbi:AMP-binding protein [Boseongicola aestuarii]|uniref:Acetyl-coenzyme A synthetase n=1 Tax=Boseongicola aestuarii TaxID=1470561 RepID=A0A238J2A5_9RHOB|nr:AMP-binding protein [Boseongicola aestuarii]SMX24305.1 Acetyl-coenzyme A synthetase [Boseongicola aestuarii]